MFVPGRKLRGVSGSPETVCTDKENNSLWRDFVLCNFILKWQHYTLKKVENVRKHNRTPLTVYRQSRKCSSEVSHSCLSSFLSSHHFSPLPSSDSHLVESLGSSLGVSVDFSRQHSISDKLPFKGLCIINVTRCADCHFTPLPSTVGSADPLY